MLVNFWGCADSMPPQTTLRPKSHVLRLHVGFVRVGQSFRNPLQLEASSKVPLSVSV
jgi:hypothetical protein